MFGQQIPIDPATLAELCRRHRVRRLSLFGSVLKGTAGPNSDIHLRVEFEPAARITFPDMARIEIELSPLLGGRKVDLRTAEDLSHFFRDQVLRTGEPMYAAAERRAGGPHGDRE